MVALHLLLQRVSIDVHIFFSEIFSYFCRFVFAFSPCQGSWPVRSEEGEQKVRRSFGESQGESSISLFELRSLKGSLVEVQ